MITPEFVPTVLVDPAHVQLRMTSSSGHVPSLRFRDWEVGEAWAWVVMWAGCTCFLTWSFLAGARLELFSLLLLALLAAMWVELVRALRQALTRPFLLVTITPAAVVLRERFIWKVRELRYRHGEVAVPLTADHGQGEPAIFYRCKLQLPCGRLIPLARLRTRASAEALQRRLMAILVAERTS